MTNVEIPEFHRTVSFLFSLFFSTTVPRTSFVPSPLYESRRWPTLTNKAPKYFEGPGFDRATSIKRASFKRPAFVHLEDHLTIGPRQVERFIRGPPGLDFRGFDTFATILCSPRSHQRAGNQRGIVRDRESSTGWNCALNWRKLLGGYPRYQSRGSALFSTITMQEDSDSVEHQKIDTMVCDLGSMESYARASVPKFHPRALFGRQMFDA